MRTIFRRISYSRVSDVISLYPLFDLHVGHIACNEDMLEYYVANIAADPTGLVILGGDLIDGITYNDRRFNPAQVAKWCRNEEGTHKGVIQKQIVRVAEILSPIAHKVVAMLYGNHESSVEKHQQVEIVKQIALHLQHAVDGDTNPHNTLVEPPDFVLGYHGFLCLTFARGAHASRFVIYCHHGYGGGRKPGGKMNKLDEMLAMYPDSDLVLAGHVHDLFSLARERIIPDWSGLSKSDLVKVGGVRKKDRLAVFCGSFLDSDAGETSLGWPRTSYAVEKGYPPLKLGAPVIRIKPESRYVYCQIPAFEWKG